MGLWEVPVEVPMWTRNEKKKKFTHQEREKCQGRAGGHRNVVLPTMITPKLTVHTCLEFKEKTKEFQKITRPS